MRRLTQWHHRCIAHFRLGQCSKFHHDTVGHSCTTVQKHVGLLNMGSAISALVYQLWPCAARYTDFSRLNGDQDQVPEHVGQNIYESKFFFITDLIYHVTDLIYDVIRVTVRDVLALFALNIRSRYTKSFSSWFTPFWFHHDSRLFWYTLLITWCWPSAANFSSIGPVVLEIYRNIYCACAVWPTWF